MPMQARLSERTHEQQPAFYDASTRLPQVGPPHVFILSNVRLYREGVAMSLARNPTVEVVGVGPASEALAFIVDLHPDVVLLDSSLVDGSGVTAAHAPSLAPTENRGFRRCRRRS